MTTPNKNERKKEATGMGQRVLGFCFAVFLGALLLHFAVDVLASIWGWLVVIAAVVVVAWVGAVVYRRWRDRW